MDSLSPEQKRRVRDHYFRPVQDIPLRRAESLMRHIFSHGEERMAFYGTERPWDILLAGVAAEVAYEYHREPHASLHLSDLPFAPLLTLVASAPRFSILNGPEKVKFVSFPGTHNYRTALADIQFHQVRRRITVRQRPQGSTNQETVWEYRVHAGFAKHAEEVDLPFSSLMQCIRQGYRVVLCGHSLGGAVAALLTLRLLELYQHESIAFPAARDPFDAINCVTFGAPLIGDQQLFHCIEICGWTQCFQHVTLTGDPVPYILTTRANQLLQRGMKFTTDVVRRFPLLQGGAAVLQLLNIITPPENWFERGSLSSSASAEESRVIEVETGADQYHCFGHYHFVLWEELRYAATSDAMTIMSLLESARAIRFRDHSINAYNKALLLHIYKAGLPD